MHTKNVDDIDPLPESSQKWHENNQLAMLTTDKCKSPYAWLHCSYLTFKRNLVCQESAWSSERLILTQLTC